MTETVITHEKLDELERKAKAATPGPWEAFNDEALAQVEGEEVTVAHCLGPLFNDDFISCDAAYIAAANPAAILALIAQHREAIGELARAEDSLRHGLFCVEKARAALAKGGEDA